MIEYNTTDVFTPTKPAKYTFVSRNDINDKLVDALMIPGKQIVVYGPSGSGKSTLLINKLEETYEGYVITRCTSDLTFEQLIYHAFDKLDIFYENEQKKGVSSSISAKITADFYKIKNEFQYQNSRVNESKLVRALPLQLNYQRLAEFFGVSKRCWILEDFHKLKPVEKVKLSQVMKVFMDEAINHPNVKIVALGAVGKAKEVIEYDREMQNRVTEIQVPLMRREELMSIILKGEDLLNIAIHVEVKKSIIKISSGLPSVVHQLCLNLCFAARIYHTSTISYEFGSKEYEKALIDYVDSNSDSLKGLFDQAAKPTVGENHDYAKAILNSIVSINHDEVTENEIYFDLKKKVGAIEKYKLQGSLNELVNEKRGEVLRFNEDSNSYSFSNPFFKVYCHCVFEKTNSNEKQLQIDFTRDKEINKQIIKKILDRKDYEDF